MWLASLQTLELIEYFPGVSSRSNNENADYIHFGSE